MNTSIKNLAALPSGDFQKVRDISIPIKNTNGQWTGEVGSAICFTGSPVALRLTDTGDSSSILRSNELMRQASDYLASGQRRFRLQIEGLSFRAQLGRNSQGEDLQLRVLPSETPSLDQLRMPDVWRQVMMDDQLLNGGLILVTAPNGQGKTTTASAIVRSRLERFSGMANTIEDPIELPLQGAWGKGGFCYQRPVLNPLDVDRPGEGYYRAMIDALRQFPAIGGGGTMLFVGEIRDGVTAAETLKAATNGHLVIATIHAKSISAAVRRMMTLSSDTAEGMEADNVREMLADSLRAVFNQRLAWQVEEEGWDSAKISGDILWSEGYESAAAKHITKNNLAELTKIATAQTAYARTAQGSESFDTHRAGLERAAKTTAAAVRSR